MLILQLYPGQTILMGKNIQVTLLGNTHGLTRVGIKTPMEIKIDKEELWDMEPPYEHE